MASLPTPLPPPTRKEVGFAHGFLVFQQMSAILVYTMGKNVLTAGLLPSAFVVMRLALAIPFMLCGSFYITRQLIPDRKYFQWMLLAGFLSIVGTQSLLSIGLSKTTATNASIISAPCTPLFTAAMSIIRGTDKLTTPKAAGFLLSIVGALILLQVENFSFEGKVIGNLMIMASSFCSALNTLVQRKILDDGANPTQAISYICVYGGLLFTSIYAHFGLFHQDNWVLPTSSITQMILVASVGTVIPWTLGSYALRTTSPMTVGIYVVLQPPLSAILGLFLGEEFTWHQGLGSVLVLSGLLFVNANTQVKKIIIVIYYRVLGKGSPHKDFQLLTNNSSEEEEEENVDKVTVEMTNLKIVVSKDLGNADTTLYSFQEKPTNDLVLESEPTPNPNPNTNNSVTNTNTLPDPPIENAGIPS